MSGWFINLHHLSLEISSFSTELERLPDRSNLAMFDLSTCWSLVTLSPVVTMISLSLIITAMHFLGLMKQCVSSVYHYLMTTNQLRDINSSHRNSAPTKTFRFIQTSNISHRLRKHMKTITIAKLHNFSSNFFLFLIKFFPLFASQWKPSIVHWLHPLILVKGKGDGLNLMWGIPNSNDWINFSIFYLLPTPEHRPD